MNPYIELLLQLYKEKKIQHDAALSLIEKFKSLNLGEKTAEPIAVVGLSCRMPLSPTKEAFWEKLAAGVDCVSSFPEARRKDTDWLIPSLGSNLRSSDEPYWKGGFLTEVDQFDNEFFHITPSEAKIMDPQQRIFLELAHLAFEDAGCPSSKLRGTNTGVFIGDVVNEYRKLITEASPLAVVGNISPFIASRVSHFYDLHGPAINVSTTCSTSLVAVHLACQSLLNRECDLALTGAVNLRLFPFALKDDPVDALGITTDKGACLAFDDRASGIVRGEGAGALVLKRLSDAVRDRNPIYALLRGSATNNDGKSSSVGAPNPLAQAALLKAAWQKGGIDPRQIDFIEAHGTGTRIGDPIEIQGIAKAFSEFTLDKQFCAIGSVKTNIGHLTGGASGLASLIKTILSLQHEQIPPTLHFEQPNSFIDFPNTPLYVAARLLPWPRKSTPRLAGVSAFGFNGSNCHVVVEEAPPASPKTESGKPFPFLFSHRTLSGLEKQLKVFLSYFRAHPDLSPEDVAYTLAFGRDRYPVQLVVTAASLPALSAEIERSLKELKPTPSKNLEEAFRGLSPRLLSLPGYVFERKRFWLEPKEWRDDDRFQTAQAEEPKLSVEETLQKLFSDALGMEKVERSENFFDLGGDSLLGMDIINSIHKRLGKKISYQDLFRYPTIAGLATLLGEKEAVAFQPILPVAKREAAPLSYGQRRLWILHQMQDHPVAYNIYDAYRFDAPLDLEAFRSALDTLAARHNGLRTVFRSKNGEPYQELTAPRPFALTVRDVPSQEAALSAIAEFRDVPFNLEEGPLAKALLLRLSPTSSLFFFMVHHIVADGWSIRIVIEELLRSYLGEKSLSSLPIDPIDAAYWQKDLFTSEKFQAMERYWLKEFEGTLPVCEIPGDLPRPAVFHFKGARKTFQLSREEQEALTRIGAKENGTLFMVLLATVYTLIHRYTGQTDLIVGSPVSGRSHADLKPLIGFFVNTLAIRCQLDPKKGFAALLSQVKEQVLHAMENQDYPFDHLIDQLKLERDTSRSPLFNINVALQNFELNPDAEAALQNLRAKRVELPHQSCKWDLEFEFVKQADGSLECFVEYYTGIYSEAMVDRLIETYRAQLRSILEMKPIPLSQLSYGIEGAKAALEEVPLHTLFERQAALHPQRPAVLSKKGALSYDALNQKANQLARFLKLKPESLVGLYLENSEESIVSILAVLKAGGAFVPLDTKAPLQRILTILKEGKIELILSKAKYRKTLDALQWKAPSLRTYICLDEEETTSELMSVELWDQVAQEAGDAIASSGWVSSYTGEAFSSKEMEEYAENIFQKLQSHLSPALRVLEIGCGSGLTAFQLAPHVGDYLGVDLSPAIIEKNREKAKNIPHLRFECCQAHEIDTLKAESFDLVIINSVIHCFPDLSYLKDVLKKAVSLMKENGLFFLGDLMDLDLKEEMEQSFRLFKEAHRNSSYRTKTDWSQELFLSRDFLLDLPGDIPAIESLSFSKKIGTLENELTRFRFDALLSVQKQKKTARPKKKDQFSWPEIASESSENLNLPVSDRSLAYVLFTSGSTGVPKGVMVEHRSVHNYIAWAKQEYREDKFPFYSPLHFDLTMTSVFTPLLHGSYLEIFSGEFDEVLSALSTSSCSILKLTPAHLGMLVDRGEPLPSIRQFIVGGEALFAPQAAALSRLYSGPIRVDNEYGPTEATVGCITHVWDSSETEGALLIGKPIANTVIHIVDADLQPVPIGGIGEIVIGGAGLARGYLNNPELTQQKFTAAPHSKERIYRTGDLGRYLPNGEIAYLGRKDRQVKIKGYRIELDEIEAQTLKHPSVASCAVIVKSDPQRGKTLCGYYTARAPLAPEELAEFLSKALPPYMIPQHLLSLAALPMTGNGKVDAARLPDPEAGKAKEILLPKTAVEQSLLAIWSRVLGIPENQLSADDDFFDLGGDSILAMRILPQIKAAGMQLSIKEIFQHRTIRALGQKMAPQESIDQSMQEGSLPWTPIQHWFWEQEMAQPSYFNMAYLFQVPSGLDRDLLQKAFWRCFAHHDAFRLSFKERNQTLEPLSALAFELTEISLADLNETEQREEIIRLTTEIQASFDLAKPPLLKAALFNLGKQGLRLFIAIHHLIIDGVSWRYLVEDLAADSLPEKTHSLKTWSESLAALPPVAEREIAPWLTLEPANFPRLSTSLFPLFGETVEEYVRFSEEETAGLGSGINEILLAALAESLFETYGWERCLIDHEGHGRNASLDISRTLGWFTTIYPLSLEKGRDRFQTLQNCKKAVQIFSAGDLSYSVSRYLQKHPHLRLFKPEILLNYFGRVDNDLLTQGGKRFFSNCPEEIGSLIHPKNRMPHRIEMNAILMENRLRVAILYQPDSVPQGKFWVDSFRRQVLAFKEKIAETRCSKKEEALCPATVH